MTKSTSNDEALIRSLAELLNESGLTEIKYEKDGLKLKLGKNVQIVATAPAPAVALPAPVAATTTAPAAVPGEIEADNPSILKSPMVGMAYTSSSPDVADFVKVGDTVTEGQTVLLIEAMKVFNPILAHKAGKVSRIFISSGSPVEYDEPLLLIE